MTEPNKIDELKSDLYSDDHKMALRAVDELAMIGGQDILDFFISLLNGDNAKIRDLAALALHDIGDNKALEPLLIAIKKPSNENSNGTMAYALLGLDCSGILNKIFDLLFYGDAEVKMAATTILNDQDFYFTGADLNRIRTKWSEMEGHSDKYLDFHYYKDTIEYFIEMFVNGSRQPKAGR